MRYLISILASLIMVCSFLQHSFAADASNVPAPKTSADFHGIYLFGEQGILVPRRVKKWQEYRVKVAGIEENRGTGLGDKAYRQMKKWQGRKPDMSLLTDVNEYWNHSINYVFDEVYHARKSADEWIDPVTLERRGVGDCEDYALAKYQMLRELGWNTDDMFLLITRLREAQTGAHAVLVVFCNNELYILDNFTDKIVTHNNYKFKLHPQIHTESGSYSLFRVKNTGTADVK